MAALVDLVRLHESACEFLEKAFYSLEQLRVIPPSRYHRHLEVGRDYEGHAVMRFDEFRSLHELLTEMFPGRFEDSLKGMDFDDPGLWIFSLLEVSIARCAFRDEPFDSRSPSVEETIAELVTSLIEFETEFAVCRVVPHLSTEDGGTLLICGFEIIPDADGRSEIPKIIPGGASAFNRDPPFVFDPPDSVIVARGVGKSAYGMASDLSERLDTFLLIIRLLFGTTAWSAYEVQGPISEIHPSKTRLETWSRNRSMVRRTLRLSKGHEFTINELDSKLKELSSSNDDAMFTSFGLALSRFTESYRTDQWHVQIIELTTALEAAISGSATTDVILRLKSRAAALLSEETDSAEQIFRDIGILYDLRSRLIHGGSLKRTKFYNSVRSISTVPVDAPIGVATAYMIDRLRDIVRRLILARIFLGSGIKPVWPLLDDSQVDACLADEVIRASFRTTWREKLGEIGAANSASPSSPALDFLSRDDRREAKE